MSTLRRKLSKLYQPFLCWLFSIVYHRWIDEGEKVTSVIGWRTARVDKFGGRKCMTPVFWWFK